MRVFNPDRVEQQRRRIKPDETILEFLERMPGERFSTARKWIELTLDLLPSETARSNAVRRLQGAPAHADAVALELALANLFSNLGVEYEYEPSLKDLTPDFCVTSSSARVIVEATTLNESVQAFEQYIQLCYIISNAVRKIGGDFVSLCIHRTHYGCRPPSANALAQFIERRLEQGQYYSAENSGAEWMRHDCPRVVRFPDGEGPSDWNVEFVVLRHDREPADVIAGDMCGHEAFSVDTVGPAVDGAAAKARRYESLNLPVFVAMAFNNLITLPDAEYDLPRIMSRLSGRSAASKGYLKGLIVANQLTPLSAPYFAPIGLHWGDPAACRFFEDLGIEHRRF